MSDLFSFLPPSAHACRSSDSQCLFIYLLLVEGGKLEALDATDRPPNANTGIFVRKTLQLWIKIVNSYAYLCNITVPTSECVECSTRLYLAPSRALPWRGLTGRTGVQSHSSTLPMPSSAEKSTQQAACTSVLVSTPLCGSCCHCHILSDWPPGGALRQWYYLVLWQPVCLGKEAIKMSLTEN